MKITSLRLSQAESFFFFSLFILHTPRPHAFFVSLCIVLNWCECCIVRASSLHFYPSNHNSRCQFWASSEPDLRQGQIKLERSDQGNPVKPCCRFFLLCQQHRHPAHPSLNFLPSTQESFGLSSFGIVSITLRRAFDIPKPFPYSSHPGL